MKTILLLLLLAHSLISSAIARGPMAVDIVTTEKGVTYNLHDYDMRIEKEHQTSDEVEAYIRKHIEQRASQLVLIRTDERTTFKAVSALLRRLKGAGMKMFSIVDYEGATMHSLTSSADKLSSRKDETPPPRK